MTDVTSGMHITITPMAIPSGITDSDFFNGMVRAEATAPRAMPTATTPTRLVAFSYGMCSDFSAHFSTISCKVAPAPQNSVVTASEIWPSLSFHSIDEQLAKSATSLIGLRSWCAYCTPVLGMRQLNSVASA